MKVKSKPWHGWRWKLSAPLSHLGEEELDVTDWDLAHFCLEIIFITQVPVGLRFYAYVKKSNAVIKLRPARRASLLSMHSSCNPQSPTIILQIIQ